MGNDDDLILLNSVSSEVADIQGGTAPLFSKVLDQHPGIFDVSVLDGIRSPVGERANRSGRVVGSVMRKHIGADHEQIVAIPALQIFVERTVAGIAAHDGAARVVRALIRHHGPRIGTRRRLVEMRRVHRFGERIDLSRGRRIDS